MLSATEIIPSDWHSHHHHSHHCSYDAHYDPENENRDHGHVDHIHDDDHDRHHQNGTELGSDTEKNSKNSGSGEQILNIIRKKKPSVEEDGLCEVQSSSKVCVDCKTTKTPLWRTGPAGPKSLCNACGIRYRKRRRNVFDLLGLQERERVLHKRFAGKEEAEAAVLLMALSCGLFVHS